MKYPKGNQLGGGHPHFGPGVEVPHLGDSREV